MRIPSQPMETDTILPVVEELSDPFWIDDEIPEEPSDWYPDDNFETITQPINPVEMYALETPTSLNGVDEITPSSNIPGDEKLVEVDKPTEQSITSMEEMNDYKDKEISEKTPQLTSISTPSAPQISSIEDSSSVNNEIPVVEILSELPRYLVSPLTVLDKKDDVYMITVVLRASGDKTHDMLRLRRIHGIITSFPGNDRFAFQVYEKERGFLLEFPNLTTNMCSDLISRLNSLVGPENVKTEKITFL